MTNVLKKKKQPTQKTLPQKMYDWEKPVPFDESFKWPGCNELITFDGPSYEDWTIAMLPCIADMPVISHREAAEQGTAVGEKYVFYRRALPLMYWSTGHAYGMLALIATPRPTRGKLEIYRRRTAGYCAFSTAVGIPVLAQIGTLTPWMSLTPNEIFTQRGQIRRTRKNTGMAGLGLGWAARKVLQRKQVDHLTVVERDEDIIKMFGTPLQKEFGNRLTIKHGDAYEHDWSQHDVSIWDIWKGWGDASDDRRFWKIKETLQADGKVCEGWGQGVWPDHY
jgi:hypothetical protein